MKTRLKELREDNDLTQDFCAKLAYISKNSYIRYEKDERMIPLDTIKIFANYYNTSIDYIVGYTDVRRKIERTEPFDLNEAEREEILRYRSLSQKEKACVRQIMETFLNK